MDGAIAMPKIHETTQPKQHTAGAVLLRDVLDALDADHEMRERVVSLLADALAEHEPAEPAPALVDRQGLARALSVSLSTVDRVRHEGCPQVTVGDSPRFRVQAVVEWLQARTNGGPVRVIQGGRT